FDIITLFPEFFDFYFKQSILARSQKEKKLKINVHQLRDFALDKHKTVDDRPFGGGRGMVLKIEVLERALNKIKNKKLDSKVVLFTPRGKIFNQKMATDWSKLDQLTLICGRYEGVDERINKLIDEKVSIGNFVMMGGDLAGLIVVESTARLISGVVGNSEALIGERITAEKGFVEYPQYTRPEVFETKNKQKLKTPKVLLSGNHKKIDEWRKKHSKVIE
ncbi:MAG: tRNA (guanosine(37)-N1)-methyltransferase TrmD, partial [Candidatus Gribaldobacteria bacterium]|nr:tRNA (guanosine(37)-N1)-methyltransferase TrmD [Candidatus Gribaldobacteria bacterium]